MKVANEMSLVSRCVAASCAYNLNQRCHAKGITVGDGITPGCDTFLDSPTHNKETRRIAGVGACKVSACSFNQDYECTAASVEVGFAEDDIRCLTFHQAA